MYVLIRILTFIKSYNTHFLFVIRIISYSNILEDNNDNVLRVISSKIILILYLYLYIYICPHTNSNRIYTNNFLFHILEDNADNAFRVISSERSFYNL